MSANHGQDGTVLFLPHRLNRQPVVVCGLTADELWLCSGLSGLSGMLLGMPLAWLIDSVALVPTAIVAGIAAGVFIGGSVLRRLKRGRPETWLHRQLLWRVAQGFPTFALRLGREGLITRSGTWSTRRGAR
ncbi:TPA: TIGR03750 family conjugal transfer protein [Pseudomonas aeruginosa]|nr:TIGR03750 family conjugal transfer protein [Pseudomonas aeruginosa]HCI2310322.1 TIGR03750 family conjugal transfer protein [Pseudomonas aeruginosa]